MIYVAQILDGAFIKVGFSKEEMPDRRISELQTGCPYQITVIFTTNGTLIQEQELHKTLKKAFGRVRIPMPPNEWYPGKNPFFQGFLEYLKYGVDAGLAYLDNYNPCVKRPSEKQGRGDTEPNFKWPEKKIA